MMLWIRNYSINMYWLDVVLSSKATWLRNPKNNKVENNMYKAHSYLQSWHTSSTPSKTGYELEQKANVQDGFDPAQIYIKRD